MSRDELRQLALAFRAIDRVINSRGVRSNTVKNRSKMMRRKVNRPSEILIRTDGSLIRMGKDLKWRSMLRW